MDPLECSGCGRVLYSPAGIGEVITAGGIFSNDHNRYPWICVVYCVQCQVRLEQEAALRRFDSILNDIAVCAKNPDARDDMYAALLIERLHDVWLTLTPADQAQRRAEYARYCVDVIETRVDEEDDPL